MATPKMTLKLLREIAAESGLAHAQFCLEQNATQHGRDALDNLFREMARLTDEYYAEDDRSARVSATS